MSHVHPPPDALAPATPEHRAAAGRAGELGMWVFIASEMLFFGGLMLAYAWGRAYDPAGFAQASRHTHVAIGTINTALLLTSSLLVALATLSAEDDAVGRARSCRNLLAGAACIGLLFLALKGVEYRMEWREHLVPGAGFFAGEAAPPLQGAALFFAFYFVATGLHAVHVAAGVVWLGTLAAAFHRRKAWADGTRTHIAGLYWHFVDAVWVLLYPLLYLVERHA